MDLYEMGLKLIYVGGNTVSPITQKQMNMIRNVEHILQEHFTGKTKQDAFLWLRDKVPLASQKILQRSEPLITIRSITKYEPYMSAETNILEQIAKHSPPEQGYYTIEDIDNNIQYLSSIMNGKKEENN